MNGRKFTFDTVKIGTCNYNYKVCNVKLKENIQIN